MHLLMGATGAFWAALRFSSAEEQAACPSRPLRCPSCYKRDCVEALPVGRFDRLFLAMHRVPYDCRVCGKRFRRFDRARAAQVAATIESIIR